MKSTINSPDILNQHIGDILHTLNGMVYDIRFLI